MPRSAFLARMSALAATEPCLVPRADLLRLLAMAGLTDTHTYQMVARGTSDLVQVDGPGLLKTVGLARGG